MTLTTSKTNLQLDTVHSLSTDSRSSTLQINHTQLRDKRLPFPQKKNSITGKQ